MENQVENDRKHGCKTAADSRKQGKGNGIKVLPTLWAQELLDLVHLLNGVQTQEEAQLWIRTFIDWYRLHEPFINEKNMDEESGRWWFTHKMLHRSVSHIKRAIPDLFSYTRYPNVPKSSNAIESFLAT